MPGIILTALSQLFAESATSMGKYEAEHNRESLYAMGFLNSFWTTVFLIGIGLVQHDLVFSLASLPTFALRMVLEMTLMIVTLHAVLEAERSTFAFLRILTIPLLLMVDLALGYSLSTFQVLGISCVVVGFVFLLTNHGLSKRGKLYSLLSAVLAVATISLYKYDITHFNSVAAEQAVMNSILLIMLIVLARVRTRENLFAYLTKPAFILQSVISGFSGVFLSYAYVFAPASIITSTKRSFEMVGAIVFGRKVFHEGHLVIKIASFALMTLGIGLILL
jgi:hypothetical protein